MSFRDTKFDSFSTSISDGPFLIVGLGNVGEEYNLTRHNAGFMALDKFSSQIDAGKFNQKPELNAEIIETNALGEKVILAKPNTFMNNSGLAIVKLQNYFAINDPRILIVYDDIDIEFGTIRSRIGGSSGGHNGIKSVEKVIGSDFARIRLGVKNPHLEHTDTADFVLAKFSRSEIENLDQILDQASNFITKFIENKFEQTSISLY